MRKRFREGSSMLEAVVCCLIIMFLLIASFHIYFQAHAATIVEEVCVEISHEAVSCTSFDEAEDLAKSEAKKRLEKYMDIDASTVECEVYYAIGGEAEWKKGNFLTIEISAHSVSPFSTISGKCKKTLTVMIERNGS